MITPVILSGGSGTRLWPVSTPDRPKQFQPLAGDASMFAQTLARVADRARFAAPVIVCGPGHVVHVRADLVAAGISDATIIVEPAARNTAPAIALAALACQRERLGEDVAHAAGAGDTPILVMPSDHVMAEPAAFLAAVATALPAVEQGALATFGIEPAGPETGYGYIARGAASPHSDGAYSVERFVEKPPLDRAQAMIDAGGHYWNAGIFLMRPDAFLGELGRLRPDIASACETAMSAASSSDGQIAPDAAAFLACPAESIDFAVMEHAANVVVVPVRPGWSDVGGWAALHALGPQDEDGNSATGDTILIDSTGNLVRAAPGRRIAMVGVHGLVVVEHGNDLLIVPVDRAQEVKRIVEALDRG